MPTQKTRQEIIDQLTQCGTLSYKDMMDFIYSIFFLTDGTNPDAYLSKLVGTWSQSEANKGKYDIDYFVSYNERIYRSTVNNNVSVPDSAGNTTWIMQSEKLTSSFGFKGKALTTTNPGVPSAPEFWIGDPGVYPNFGNQTISGVSGFLIFNGGSWSSINLNIDLSAYMTKDFAAFGGRFATIADANTAIKNTVVGGKNQRDGKWVYVGPVGSYISHSWIGGTADVNLRPSNYENLARFPISFVADSAANKYVLFSTSNATVTFPVGFSVGMDLGFNGEHVDRFIQTTAEQVVSLYSTAYDGTSPLSSTEAYFAINKTTKKIVLAYWKSDIPVGWVIFGFLKRDTSSTTVLGSIQVFGEFKYLIDGQLLQLDGKPHINSFAVGYLNYARNFILSRDRKTITIKAAGISVYIGDTRNDIVGTNDLVFNVADYPGITRLFLYINVSLLVSGSNTTSNWTTTPGLISVVATTQPKGYILATTYSLLDDDGGARWNVSDAGLSDYFAAADEENLRLNYIYPFWQSEGTGQDLVELNPVTNELTIPAGYSIGIGRALFPTTASQKISLIGTNTDDVTPVASSISYLFYNPETKKVTNRWFSRIEDPKAVLIGIVKRNTPSASVVGELTIYGYFKYTIVGSSTQSGVVSRNSDKDAEVYAAIFPKFIGGASTKRFNLLWASDPHGDLPTARNFMSYLNSKIEISAALLTGDFALNDYSSPTDDMMTVFKGTTKPVFTLIGNHDAGNSQLVSISGTNAQVYTRFISPFVASMGLSSSENTGLNYYYKDFASNKIRAIAIYEYDDDNALATGGTNFKVNRGFRTFRKAQIDWLTNLLLNTPSDYSVMCWVHQAPVHNYEELNLNFDKGFTCNVLANQSGVMTSSYVDDNGSILVDIFAAWKAGTAINKTYTPSGLAAYLPAISVNVNFASRGVGMFIAFMGGHHHRDIYATTVVGGLNYLAVTCNTADAGQSQFDDLPRVRNTKTEDVFNVFSVDTTDRKIYIVRIGSDVNNKLNPRRMLSISY